MVADAAVAATENVDGVLNKAHAFIVTAQSAAADGLTWHEFGELFMAMLRLIVSQIDAVSTLTGPEKKSLAVVSVQHLFDGVADLAVPRLAYPFWVIARPTVRAVILAIAGGVVEQLLPLVRSAA